MYITCYDITEMYFVLHVAGELTDVNFKVNENPALALSRARFEFKGHHR